MLLDDLDRLNEKRNRQGLELVRYNEELKQKELWLEQKRQTSPMERYEALLVQKNEKVDDLSTFWFDQRKPTAGLDG